MNLYPENYCPHRRPQFCIILCPQRQMATFGKCHLNKWQQHFLDPALVHRGALALKTRWNRHNKARIGFWKFSSNTMISFLAVIRNKYRTMLLNIEFTNKKVSCYIRLKRDEWVPWKTLDQYDFVVDKREPIAHWGKVLHKNSGGVGLLQITRLTTWVRWVRREKWLLIF